MNNDLSDAISAAIGEAVGPWPEVPCVVVAVRRGREVVQAAWSPDRAVGPDAAFRTASITKTFTATTALRLVNDGVLELDAPIAPHVSRHVLPLLPKLFSEPEEVTLRHLLQHTSGVADYAEDPRWQAEKLADLDRTYEAMDMLLWVAENMSPLGPAGEASRYSDTGYVVVADIISAQTGHDYASALRLELDFERLGLVNTWMEEREPAPSPRPKLAPSNVRGLDVWAIHPSYDTVGGGGLVSTTTDLVTYFDALLGGDLLPERLLAEMQTVVPSNIDGEAGLGLFRRQTGFGESWGHTGIHGGFAYVVPSLDLTVAGSICSYETSYETNSPRTAVINAVAALF